MIQLDDLTVSRPLAFDDPAATHEVACQVTGPAHDGRYTIVYRLPDDGDAELARVHVAAERAAAAVERPVRRAARRMGAPGRVL